MLTVYSCNPELSAERFDTEVVVIDVMQGIYFSLRGAAAELWTRFQVPRSQATAIAVFADASISAEAATCVQDMVVAGLLKTIEASDTPNGVDDPLLRFEAPA